MAIRRFLAEHSLKQEHIIYIYIRMCFSDIIIFAKQMPFGGVYIYNYIYNYVCKNVNIYIYTYHVQPFSDIPLRK